MTENRRYFLEIAYHGKSYHGWQIQQNAHSVQQELNTALKQLFCLEIPTVASGRTDTGVHAEQQFVHVDLPFELTEKHLFQLNRILPLDIVIKDAKQVKSDAHARFDALSRKYEYRISTKKNPFISDVSYFYPRNLNLMVMREACGILIQYEDFECFSKVRTDVGHFLCNIYAAFWEEKEDMLVFTVEANRFLRGMVRTIVGTMLEVGLGRITCKKFEEIIHSRDRKSAGRAVAPEGLFLTEIKYPAEIFLKE